MTALILASGSATRQALLSAAGLIFAQQSPQLDERALKQAARAANETAAEAALSLARAKVAAIAPQHPALVAIAADQILECEDRWYDKPSTVTDARQQLIALRGKTHRLWTAVVTARGETEIWHHTAKAEMRMRAFSDRFLDVYVEATGPEMLNSVGAYALEGLGIQLFDEIRGDYFGILGLPLLVLIGHLREIGALIP